VKTRSSQQRLCGSSALKEWTRLGTAGLLLAVVPGALQAQAAAPLTQSQPSPANAAQSPSPAAAAPAAAATSDKQDKDAKQDKPTRTADRRRAAKIYFAASKLFEKGEFEEAGRGYEQAAKLDPTNADYPLAVDVARSHQVTALIQTAAKDRLRGDSAASRAALAQALALDPGNAQIKEHLNQLGDEALLGETRPLYEQSSNTLGETIELAPAPARHSFHLHTDQRQLIPQVFKAYGLEATVDDSVRAIQVRFDVDNVPFEEAVRILGLITATFHVPLDAHRALVARNTRENRTQFLRQDLETIYLSGLSTTELTDVGSLAKNVFDIQQATVEPSAGTITIRAPERTLRAFNSTMAELLDGKSQVMLNVRVIQLAHTSARNTGVQPPQTMTAFNVYAEEQSILNANSSLVQQIISSGLAAPGDTLAILGILLASGQVSSSIFSNGVALFGGGITQSALAPGTATANFSLNTSDSRELDQIQLRLGDGEASTLRSGTRYPIQTSSFSSLSASSATIAGLSAAGSSSSLSSLLASYGSSVPNVPQVEYQDLGLTLKATPKVLRNGDVALTVDMKIDALSGSSINGNPILNNRAYAGVITLKEGEAVMVASEMDKSESRAVSGTPGISEIPGLNDLTDKDKQKNYATLLIIMTPHVIRGTQAAGHSAVMRIERGQSTR
jgi:tetratricopeptide (TPR) repeat protein